MLRSYRIFLLTTAALAFACATQSQLLANKQSIALQAAVSRGQFELNCPTATGTVLSQEVVQPALQGPWVNGIQRAEYTVGIDGCGQRATLVVICPETGDGCFAAGPGPFIPGR